ncbi:hypothetical protein CQA66_08460 [Helicobacter aurati]|uniref:Uncharacterized protein n=1 Tax=Helicobacter aurati TaxID=137778 RepID=A0A3D8J0X6_9HELI|nr:DUF2612 domain-containing protein [Helicobacter aurati]RDU70431.1 hypothetical protein CQA66_08460 [Helicobacter aurati]
MATIQDQFRGTNIETLLKELDKVINKHSINLISFLNEHVNNLDTATDYGLDLWGRLLGFPRYIPVEASSGEIKSKYFNFYENSFHKLQFYKKVEKFTYTALSDDSYRIILKSLTLKLTQDCTLPKINDFCEYLFSNFGGASFIRDSYDMKFATYIFRYEIPDWLKYVIEKYDILPRPAGVGARYLESLAYYIGFNGQSRYKETGQRDFSNFYKSIFKPVDKKRFIHNAIQAYKPLQYNLFYNFMPAIIERPEHKKTKRILNKYAEFMYLVATLLVDPSNSQSEYVLQNNTYETALNIFYNQIILFFETDINRNQDFNELFDKYKNAFDSLGTISGAYSFDNVIRQINLYANEHEGYKEKGYNEKVKDVIRIVEKIIEDNHLYTIEVDNSFTKDDADNEFTDDLATIRDLYMQAYDVAIDKSFLLIQDNLTKEQNADFFVSQLEAVINFNAASANNDIRETRKIISQYKDKLSELIPSNNISNDKSEVKEKTIEDDFISIMLAIYNHKNCPKEFEDNFKSENDLINYCNEYIEYIKQHDNYKELMTQTTEQYKQALASLDY